MKGNEKKKVKERTIFDFFVETFLHFFSIIDTLLLVGGRPLPRAGTGVSTFRSIFTTRSGVLSCFAAYESLLFPPIFTFSLTSISKSFKRFINMSHKISESTAMLAILKK